MTKLSLVGLGKLGLCLAICFAEKGFEVLGVDIEWGVVNSINQGKALWFEKDLDRLLMKHGGISLCASLKHKRAIEETDITFILVATPSNPDGSFSNRFVESALISLAKELKESKKEHHLFVISSTVMPGSTEEIFIPLIEKYSERKLNQGFSVCYDPDFVAIGNIIRGFLSPDMVVIGESNSAAGDQIEKIHQQMCENKPVISRMSITNAELSKVCLNAYITTKISFANSLANLCEKIPNADVDVVTNAIGNDKRIAPYYLQGGLAFGGTCFPRDTKAYITIADRYGVQADIIKAVEKTNQFQNNHLVEKVLKELEICENKTIGILGLSFVPNTAVITESPAIKLIQELLRYDLRIIVYDSLAVNNTKSILGSSIEYVETVEECMERAGLVVLTLRDKEMKVSIEKYVPTQEVTLLDCWRVLESTQLNSLIKYVTLGKGQVNE